MEISVPLAPSSFLHSSFFILHSSFFILHFIGKHSRIESWLSPFLHLCEICSYTGRPPVPNDSLWGSKVVPDEPGRAGRDRPFPARLAGRVRPPQAGPAWPACVLLCGRGTREERRREAAHRRAPPSHSYHRGLVIQ